MENETGEVVTPEVNEEIVLDDFQSDESQSADENKKDFSDEERLAYYKRRAAQIEKKLGKTDSETTKVEKESKKDSKSVDLDYGAKAFLRSYDIKGADEIALVKTWQQRTGDELDTIVEDEIFLERLEKLRMARDTKSAMPSTTKRTSMPARDSVDYWLQKPFDSVPDELKYKVLQARIKKEKDTGMFSNNPVVMGN